MTSNEQSTFYLKSETKIKITQIPFYKGTPNSISSYVL